MKGGEGGSPEGPRWQPSKSEGPGERGYEGHSKISEAARSRSPMQRQQMASGACRTWQAVQSYLADSTITLSV